MKLAEEIKPLVDGEIVDSQKELMAYSHDASIFEVKPSLIVKPKHVNDIRSLVNFVRQEKPNHPELSLTARSAGTDMSGGPLTESIVVDFPSHFNKIVQVTDEYATVEPGVYWRDLEKILLARKVIMPSYPASRMLCTVGGMVNNNSGGEKSLSEGQTKDYVEELEMVLSDGEKHLFKSLTADQLQVKLQEQSFEGQIYRDVHKLIEDNWDLIKKSKPQTSKNSAGYFLWDVWDKEKKNFNICKLLSGSQGTLGLVTKIKFRLVHYHPKSELLVMFLKDLKPLGDLVTTVMKYKPETFESFDNHTFDLAIKFLPDMMKRMGGNMFLLGLEFLPEVWMAITGGVPKLILIAEFTGDTEEEIAKLMRTVEAEVKEKFGIKTHITKSAQEASKYWTIRRESFSLLREHVHGLHTAPFIDDVIVKHEYLPEFLPKLNAILDKYPSLIYTIAGHAGDANFHIIPLMNLADPKEREIIPKLSDEVYELVLEYGGSITAEHNDGIIRTPYLEKMYGLPMCKVFAKVKKIFDPLNIFNPGKKVGGTLAYALKHIKHS